MFIYSLKASTIKFFGVICVAMVALIGLIVFVPPYSGDVDAMADTRINYSNIKSESDRRDFLKQFGWEVADGELESIEISVPDEFDKIMTEYNELQRRQGLDLSKFKGKKVTRYTYKISNYPGYEGTVYANLIVYKNKIIGGDICSADVKGFIHGFEKQQ